MSKTRSVLGKGLGALIPGFSEEERLVSGGIELAESSSEIRPAQRHEPAIRGIEISKISPNPQQPRKDFSKESLAELTQSIQEHGLIQPITVRRVAGDRYELISGERRIRAAMEAGLASLPAYIIEVESDRKMLELAIVENVQRVELNPIEEAEAYQRLIEDCGLTQEEVAEKISKDRTSVANFIRLLKLPEPIKDSIRAGELGMGHAKAILSVPDRAKQSKLWSEAVREHYSVRKLEELARAANNPGRPGTKPAKRAISISANGLTTNGNETSADIRAIESGFQQVLGTQVKVRVKADKTGEIAIQFFSLDEFERLRELLATITTE
jgi:ParB family chromosome partitioning protein